MEETYDSKEEELRNDYNYFKENDFSGMSFETYKRIRKEEELEELNKPKTQMDMLMDDVMKRSNKI